MGEEKAISDVEKYLNDVQADVDSTRRALARLRMEMKSVEKELKPCHSARV